MVREDYCAINYAIFSGLIYSAGFANFTDEWSQCDFCFTNFGVILQYLESSITAKNAIFRLSSMWSWHVYVVVQFYSWFKF